MNEMSMSQFLATYNNNLAEQCVPDCFADLCQGWTQETFRQVVLTMTKRGTAPLKLWFDSPEEMAVLSNKRASLVAIYKMQDHLQLKRIDTLELFAVILVSIEGHFDVILTNIMLVFGFSEPNEFSRDEFHYFLDCLFRGLMKIAIPKKEKKPCNPGKKIGHSEIEMLITQVYPSNINIVDRTSFIELMQANRDVSKLIEYFHKQMYNSVAVYRQKTLERIQITQFIRRIMLEIQKNMYLKIKEIEESKVKKEEEQKLKATQPPNNLPVKFLNATQGEPQIQVPTGEIPDANQNKQNLEAGNIPKKVFHENSQRRIWKYQ